MQKNNSFEAYLQEANQAHFSGWDFGFLEGRLIETDPPWDYRAIVLTHLPNCNSILDLGTGGGEFLSGLPGLPPHTRATEGWLPNLDIARQKLSSLGIQVHFFEDESSLPFENEQFDLIINRHESFSAPELARILKRNGLFVTQQVGGLDNLELNRFLAPDLPLPYASWNLETATAQLRQNGFEILDKKEAKITYNFQDIGAVVYYLKVCEWQIPGFTVDGYRSELHALHQVINQRGKFESSGERFLIQARKE